MTSTNSAAACVDYVCKHYKVRTSNASFNNNMNALIDALRDKDFYACDLRTDIVGLIDCPLPAIIQTTTQFMVVIKSNSVGVTVMDPTDGNIHRIAYHDLIKIWTGVVIVIEPPPAKNKHSFFARLFT